ncbi:MAG: methionyl-tRNA formyltransferase [Lentimonas sp.]|jgi:methionyl-tRNA formyltransferase
MSEKPVIVFFGSDAICLPVLDYLRTEASALCQLRAVVSQPDRPQGRGKKLQSNPVAAWAKAHGVELLQPEKPTAELAEWLREADVAVALVMAYGHFLSQALREAPRCGMFNFHGSLLPKYRGASPVETAIASGDVETGVGLMEVVREMDAGGVADVEKVRIEATATGPEVRGKIGVAVVPLLRRNLDALLRGQLLCVPQDLAAVSYARKISREDGGINFALPAQQIYDRLRAFTPWPGGYFEHAGVRIKVGRASCRENASEQACGTVVELEPALCIATEGGEICFHELQRPGGRLLPVADFLRGYPISVGAQCESTETEPLVRLRAEGC